MAWTPKATLQFANDLITASLVEDITSETRAAIQAIANALFSSAVAADPTLAANVLAAAEVAVTDAAATGRFVKALDAPGVAGDNGTIYLGSQSGYALLGWKNNGDFSDWTKRFLKEQVVDLFEVPKIPHVYKIELTPSGYATRIIYDDGTQELPGLIGVSGSSDPTVTYDVVGGNTYVTDITTGIRTRVGTDRTRLVINGTSTFNGMVSQFTTFATPHGATVVNTATAGVGAEHTLAKLGSRPLLTSGTTTINGSGTSSVTSSNVPSSIYNPWSVSGYFEGYPSVHGTISKPADGGASSWTFTRDSSGASFTLPAGTKFIPDAAAYRNAILVLNIGKNNLAGTVEGVTTDVAQIIQWTKDAYEWATSTGKSVLVVGHFHNTGTPADSVERTRINTYRDAMSSYFGARFVDMGAYVGSTQIFTDLGLTPTSADLAEIALGNKAPQISSLKTDGSVDELHLSTAGKSAVVDNRIGRQLTTTLNWMLEAA